MISKLSLKYQRNILWQWLYTQNRMRFEKDLHLTSWECTGNHKLSLFLSLRVEIYCFIWGSCLEKVSVFFIINILSFILLLQSCPQQVWNWNLFWFITHIELLVSFSYNIGKVLVLKERQTYYFSNYFPVFLQFFPVLCNLAWGEWSRMILVQRGSSRFAEDSFAHTIASSECKSYVRCTQDIKPHQYGA